MSCFHWELKIHGKNCPEKRQKFTLSTNKDTYEVDTLEELFGVIKQDLGEENAETNKHD